MIYDLIALGETMATFCPPPGISLANAPDLLVDHGGAESNTCVGLARLGFQVAWVSKLGADPLGDRVLEALQKEGLDTRWVGRDATRPTGVMIKDPVNHRAHYYRAGSAASSLCPKDLDGILISAARAVLVTGITAQIGADPQSAALAFLSSARGLRVVDPNFRRGLWGSDCRVELVLPLIRSCDLVLAGDQELAEIFGQVEPQELARRCLQHGPREVVVRCDDRVGSLTSTGEWRELAIQCEAASDPMGAGDAFNAGYIGARLCETTMDESLRFAVHCGRAVALSQGDTSGFPRDLRVR